jgi:4-diphosphocytidyl-2-C-methyl-D-erythritol kinase
MGEQTASYRVRLARPDEVPRLRAIEDAAGTLFSGLGLIDEALDVSFPLDDLARLVGMGQVWAGCLEDGFPVGMVIASVREETVYVEEMDVLPEHGRRGLGARLCLRMGASARLFGGHPVDFPRRAMEWTVLPKARLPGPGARGMDAGHAGDPRAGSAARPPC